MTSDGRGPERPIVAPEGLRFSGDMQDGSGQGQPGGGLAQPRLQGRSSTQPLVNGSFGSFDFAELLKAPPSAGELTIQDLLAANPDWADQAVVSVGEAERNLSGGAEVGPDGTSPLLRWTSDGSMMEELLKTFTPGTPTFQQGGVSNPFQNAGTFSSLTKHPSFSTALMKDPSLGSAVFSALMSQNSEDPLTMLAALPSLNSLGSSIAGIPPPSSQQPETSTPLEAAESQPALRNTYWKPAIQPVQPGQGYEQPAEALLQNRAPSLSFPLGVTSSEPGQGYDGSREALLEFRAPSLTFPTGLPGSQMSRPNSASDAGPSRGASPAPMSGHSNSQLSAAVLSLPIELPHFSEELQYTGMRAAQHPPEMGQIEPSQQEQAFVLGSKVVSLPKQTGRPASAPVVRYGVDGFRIPVGPQQEAPVASLALQGNGRAQSLPIDFARQGGGALHIVDEPTTSGRLLEATYQPLQHPQLQEQYGVPAGSYALPVQSMLHQQGGAIVQTPQQLSTRAGLPPVGGSRVQASLQAQRMARIGANAQSSSSGGPGFAAQAQAPRPDFQAPRAGLQAPIGNAQKVQPAMQPPLLTGPPVLLRPDAAQLGAVPGQPGIIVPGRQQQGLPQAALMPTSGGQELSQQPMSSATGLPPPPSGQIADQVQIADLGTGEASISAAITAGSNGAVQQAAGGPSSFLSGLMTGIQPVVSNTVPAGPATTVAMPQVPYVKPLPPLPAVPTIAEHYGTMGPPRLPLASAGQGASYPPAHAPSALEVLPLVGTTTLPQILPLNLTSQPVLAVRPAAASGQPFPMLQVVNKPLPSVSITTAPRGAAAAAAAVPSYPGQRVMTANGGMRQGAAAPGVPLPAGGTVQQQNGTAARYITVPGTQGVPRAPTIFTKPSAPVGPAKAKGVASTRSPPGNPASNSDATSSGSGGKAKRERAGQVGTSSAKRSAVSSASMNGLPPQHPPMDDEEGASMDDANDDSAERSMRRAIRKEKNRASAAASRARREAYTASLEEEVKRLREGQEWLRLQIQQQEGLAEATANRPKRQLSL